MQVCGHCGTGNLEGTIYCQNCGVALVAVPLSTRRLRTSDDPGGVDGLSLDGVLILQIGDVPEPIVVQVREEVVLGRYAHQGDGPTYLNLTPYGAAEAGVSRRHARLLRVHRAVYLMDMNSTNGTQLNGQPLPAGVEKRLRDGDEILLGQLKVTLFFGS